MSEPDPDRPGCYFIYRRYFWHVGLKRRIYAPPGKMIRLSVRRPD